MSLGNRVIALICLMVVSARASEGEPPKNLAPPAVRPDYSIPLIDLASQK